MHHLHRIPALLAFVALSCLVSCETLDEEPEPQRGQLSNIPHNKPQPWEGQAGLPGYMGAQGQY